MSLFGAGNWEGEEGGRRKGEEARRGTTAKQQPKNDERNKMQKIKKRVTIELLFQLHGDCVVLLRCVLMPREGGRFLCVILALSLKGPPRQPPGGLVTNMSYMLGRGPVYVFWSWRVRETCSA